MTRPTATDGAMNLFERGGIARTGESKRAGISRTRIRCIEKLGTALISAPETGKIDVWDEAAA